MRHNFTTKEIYVKWLEYMSAFGIHCSAKAGSVRFEGNKIYSYSTLIGYRVLDSSIILLQSPQTRVCSRTTRKHITQLSNEISHTDWKTIAVYDYVAMAAGAFDAKDVRTKQGAIVSNLADARWLVEDRLRSAWRRARTRKLEIEDRARTVICNLRLLRDTLLPNSGYKEREISALEHTIGN